MVGARGPIPVAPRIGAPSRGSGPLARARFGRSGGCSARAGSGCIDGRTPKLRPRHEPSGCRGQRTAPSASSTSSDRPTTRPMAFKIMRRRSARRSRAWDTEHRSFAVAGTATDGSAVCGDPSATARRGSASCSITRNSVGLDEASRSGLSRPPPPWAAAPVGAPARSVPLPARRHRRPCPRPGAGRRHASALSRGGEVLLDRGSVLHPLGAERERAPHRAASGREQRGRPARGRGGFERAEALHRRGVLDHRRRS